MSYDQCKYCGGYSFKTNGSGEHICYVRAESGECDPTSPSMSIAELKEQERDAYDYGKSIREIRRANDRKKKGKRKYGFK